MLRCPFCDNGISERATVCLCGAEKGYRMFNGNIVYRKSVERSLIIVCLIAFAPIFFFGANAITLFIAAFAAIDIIANLLRLMRGPRWWR